MRSACETPKTAGSRPKAPKISGDHYKVIEGKALRKPIHSRVFNANALITTMNGSYYGASDTLRRAIETKERAAVAQPRRNTPYEQNDVNAVRFTISRVHTNECSWC